MPRYLKTLALLAAGLVTARLLVVILDTVAETVERRTLYR
jgi:hypothetical protein